MTILISAHRGDLLKLADWTVKLELGKIKSITAISTPNTIPFSAPHGALDTMVEVVL